MRNLTQGRYIVSFASSNPFPNGAARNKSAANRIGGEVAMGNFVIQCETYPFSCIWAVFGLSPLS